MTKSIKKLTLVEVLQTVNDGGCLEELGRELRSVVAAVDSTGKPGSVTLKLTVKKRGRIQIDVVEQVSSVVPKPAVDPSMFFVTEDGSLSRQNPEQGELIGVDHE